MSLLGTVRIKEMSVVVIKRVVHVVIELDAVELGMLRDMLREMGNLSQTLGAEYEQLRTDLIYNTPVEDV